MVLVSFLYSVPLKSIGLACPLNGYFTHAWFYNIRHCSFRKYWFIELHRSARCWCISLCSIKSLHSLILLLIILGVYILGSCLCSWCQIQVFQHSHFCLKVQILPLTTNLLIIFPWRQPYFVHFSRKSLPLSHE